MITTFFILIALFALNLTVSVFPTSSGFPAEVDTAIASLGGYVGILDPLVPISTMATIIGLIVGYELLIFAFKGFRWLFSHVPFLGSKN